MPIISLTTDWGLRDPYAGSLKGALLKAIQTVQIVEISHQIDHHDLTQASYIFKNSWISFPDQTVHIIAINSHTNTSTNLLVFEHFNHYFICYDCGIITLIFQQLPDRVYRVVNNGQELSKLLVRLAHQIISGKPMEESGTLTDSYTSKLSFAASIDNNIIIGHIIYIDGHGNLVTNIDSDFFESIRKGRDFSILLKNLKNPIETLSNHYKDVPYGEVLAYINEAGYLEIGLNQSSANKLLDLKYGETFKISFNDNKSSKADHKASSFA